MTTLLADFHKGVMVADSAISDGDRVWQGRKIFRIHGSLFGFAGHVSEAHAVIAWMKSGENGRPPTFVNCTALLMTSEGLFYFSGDTKPVLVERGIFSIGSGDKAAMSAYEAMGFTDPIKAVRIVCRHDNASRIPVRSYYLKGRKHGH